MKPKTLTLILLCWLTGYTAFPQHGNDYTTTSTIIIKNADLVGDNEIDTGNFTILKFFQGYDAPGWSDEEHERHVFIKVRSLNHLILNKTYSLPDSEILAKTYYHSAWTSNETNKISGTITRTEKNDTSEIIKLNLSYIYNKDKKKYPLLKGQYAFKYEPDYFKNNAVDYNGIYNNLRIALKEPLKVRSLNLSQEGVWKYQKNLTGKQELPAEIGNFTNLEVLNLHYQGLQKLPATFSRLTNLSYLDVSYNYALTFPMEILSCSNLRELNLELTKIDSLPLSFSKLEKLEVLNIRTNPFKSFPEVIDQLPNLKLLIISEKEFDKNTMSELEKQNKKYKIQIDSW